MKNNMIGFIGAGNMASAIIHGMIESKKFNNNSIAVFDRDESKTELLKNELGITVAKSNEELIEKCATIILAVKPIVFPSLLPELSSAFEREKTFLISIAAGQELSKIKSLVKCDLPIVRVMPNINAVAGEAISGYTANEFVNEEETELAKKILNCFGKAVEIDEKLFSVFSAVAGCSPAYVYSFADTVSRTFVKYGITKKEAIDIVCNEIIKCVNETGKTEIDEEFDKIINSALKSAYEKDKKI